MLSTLPGITVMRTRGHVTVGTSGDGSGAVSSSPSLLDASPGGSIVVAGGAPLEVSSAGTVPLVVSPCASGSHTAVPSLTSPHAASPRSPIESTRELFDDIVTTMQRTRAGVRRAFFGSGLRA
jgi:hypothetical protein